MTQNELIELILKGNQEAFRTILEQYKGKVFRTCMGFVHDKEDAEELTQDVFVNLYQNLDRFKGNSSFSTWIYRITVNSSLNHLRKKRKFGFMQRLENIFGAEIRNERNSEMNLVENPEKILLDNERNRQLYAAIDSLPKNQHIAFTLSKYEEMSQREISNVMGITEGAVEALLQRAKANLQKKLSGLIKKKKLTIGKSNK